MSAVFSEYELREMGISFDAMTKGIDSAVTYNKKPSYKSTNCVGSSEEELDTRVISKSCRGVVVKKVVKGKGTGKVTVSMHCPYDVYTEAYGMELDTLIEGVKAYGTNSIHKAFSVVQHVYDEDGNEKFKAYPNCIIESGKTSKITNGAEEVAEIDLEISLMPDIYGNCEYEALASELTDETAKTTWMTAFTPDLVKEPVA